MSDAIAQEISFDLKENPVLTAVLWEIVKDSNYKKAFGGMQRWIIIDSSKLSPKEVDEALLELQDRKIIVGRMLQVGTAGTSDYFFQLADCDIKMTIRLK